MRAGVGILMLLAWPAAVCAQARPDPGDAEAGGRSVIGQLGEEFKKLGDWGPQAELFSKNMEDIWARNEWNGEADLFARDMFLEVVQIPPWQFDQRIDKMVERVGERYEMSEQGRGLLKGSMYREMLGGLWKHRGVIFGQTREMVGRMASGEPFSAEEVAEWTRETEPFMEEMRQRSARIIEDFGGLVGESHREQLERDVESFGRRMTYMEQQREAWAAGGWKPEDWGMGDDPAYREWADRQNPKSETDRLRDELARRLAGRVVAHDPATWQWHLRWVITHYRLDPGQVSAAESIHLELFERANDYMRPRSAELGAVPAEQRATHEAFATVRDMFSELKTRLDRIPTASQRAEAMR